MKALFDLLRGPAAVLARCPGVRWRGLLVCAIDGTVMTVAETTEPGRLHPAAVPRRLHSSHTLCPGIRG